MADDQFTATDLPFASPYRCLSGEVIEGLSVMELAPRDDQPVAAALGSVAAVDAESLGARMRLGEMAAHAARSGQQGS